MKNLKKDNSCEFLRVKHFANIDIYREERTGIPEVIIAAGKKKEHLISIIKKVAHNKERVILTRISLSLVKEIKKLGYFTEHNEEGRVCVVSKKKYEAKKTGGRVGIITAGTSDIQVAEEAKVIAEQLGCRVFTAYDVGIAGVHRLFPTLEKMRKEKVDVYIVAAGREGALPTLVAGMVDAPVIGLPISTGYGIAGKGKTALYAMLQSCSPLVVVNIDAGFVAGAVSAQIANRMAGAKR
ncbi:MAG: nickel pincer cofactor biosynthesis protein LarB [Thermoplasmata archaeon]